MKVKGSINLTPEQIQDINQAGKNGFSPNEISKEFKMNYKTVYSVLKRKT